MPSSTNSQLPLVSALVSTYKAGRFMRSLLEDLEAQTIVDQLEIVIVDSASPESEGEIVREFQQNYANIVYVRTQERENLYQALNRCIGLARGKYLTLANTDDRHSPEAFERLAALLESQPEAALAYADIALTRNEQDIIHNRPLAEAEILASYRWPDFDPISFFARCYAGPQPMWRRSLHARFGGFDPEFAYAGDYEFWLRLVSRGQHFVHLPEVLGLMLYSAASVSHADLPGLRLEGLRCRERYWPVHQGPIPEPSGPAYLIFPVNQRQQRPELYPTQERVSVLIRVGADPQWLLESLQTLREQNYPHLEVILLDSGRCSLPDLTAFEPHFPIIASNVRGLTPEHARNQGLGLISGQYLFFMNSGDRWHGHHLLCHLKALQTHEWAYSEAFRLPHRQTRACIEGIRHERNNRTDLSLGSQFGQFIASVALSFRTSLIQSFDPETVSCQQADALRGAEFFGAQMQRYPDWDLQWLALEKTSPQRLDTISCEFFDEADPIPDGKPLLQRLCDSVTR